MLYQVTTNILERCHLPSLRNIDWPQPIEEKKNHIREVIKCRHITVRVLNEVTKPLSTPTRDINLLKSSTIYLKKGLKNNVDEVSNQVVTFEALRNPRFNYILENYARRRIYMACRGPTPT